MPRGYRPGQVALATAKKLSYLFRGGRRDRLAIGVAVNAWTLGARASF